MTTIVGKAGARLRRRLRVRDEEGFITLQAMAIVIIMLGTMLFIVGAAASSRNAARESREFTEVARGNDQGQARLLNDWNNGYYHPFGAGQPTGGGLTSAPNYSASYSLNATEQTATLTSTASNGSVTDTETKTTNTTTYPVRSKLVSSSKATDKGVAAGIPAGPGDPYLYKETLGAWGSAVSTSGNTVNTSTWISHVRSVYGNEARTIPGRWDVYGGNIGYAGGAKVVAYGDNIARPTNPGIAAAGMEGSYERSQINAYLDEKQHNKLMANVVTNNASCSGAVGKGAPLNTSSLSSNPATYFCAKGNVTLGNIVRNVAGVTTVVVKGNVTFTGGLSTGTAGEVHFYVDGQVFFSGAGTQNFNRVYFFAPNQHCVNAAGTIVTLTGSAACLRVQLAEIGSWIAWVRPRNQPTGLPYTYTTDTARNIDPPTPVYYFEKPGFDDGLPGRP